MIKILHPNEFCQRRFLEKHQGIFDTLGFNNIASHANIVTTGELHDSTDVPFTTNSIYVYCVIDDKLKEKMLDTWASKNNPLKKKTLKERLELTILLQGGPECDYFYMIDPVREATQVGDVILKANGNVKGWYNISNNILWLSDLTHSDPSRFLVPVLEGLLRLKNGKKDIMISDPRLINSKITFGADPEMEVFDDGGNYIEANKVLPPSLDAAIGVDGYNVTGELRPKPSPSPLGVARNINRLITQMAIQEKLRSYQIKAGAGTVHHLGGHVHVSYPLTVEEGKVLYDLVGEAALKCMTGPRVKRNDIIARGCVDAIRPNPNRNEPLPHAGNEWRQLPSFIESEETTKAALCTVAMVVKEMKLHPIDSDKTMRMSMDQRIDMLRSMTLYPEYKEYVETYINKFYIKKTCIDKTVIWDGWNTPKNSDFPLLKIFSPHYKELCKIFPDIALPKWDKPVELYINVSNENGYTNLHLHRAISPSKQEIIKKEFIKMGRRLMLDYSLDLIGKNTDKMVGNYAIKLFLPRNYRNKDVNVIAAYIGPVIREIGRALN